ncbi:MAG: YdcF family protein [Bacteroidia bacterium]
MMFFYLSKILAFLIMPMTWISILLLCAVFSKNLLLRRKALITATAVFFFFSNSFILDEFMRVWEVPASKEPAAGSYDAIIVLGGMSSWDPDLERIQFMRGGDRLLQALTLLKKGVAPKMLISGGSGSIAYQEYKESDHIKSFLQEIGIPDSIVFYENQSRNTYENAVAAKPILQKIAPGGKYLLVTSAFHMRRSIACFAKAGIHVVPYSADRYSGPRKFEFDHLFIPDVSTLYNWNQLFHEWVGSITYKLKGYI